ncbi:hypothetical protein BOX15_Mlig018311g2 [Macrostomum lignano]|uniref:Uncharacterized protein n=2 Tax=Macrostomum lignano TaxID=282301 RepID=A0A267ERX2_9PLAT|nr:hypothetical protein BOX15_Mlig018311g2 [Macrostomum lignano]
MKAGTGKANSTSNGSGTEAKTFALIDQLVDKNRDLLDKSAGDRVAEDIQARLAYPWCTDLPVVLSKRLPLLARIWCCVKRWTWRFMLIYLLYAAASATVSFYFESQIDAWQRSDAYTDYSLGVNYIVRKLAVWTGTPKMDSVQELAAGECLLSNPIYRKPLMCCNCKFNVTLSKVTDVPKVMENFDKLVSTGRPRAFIVVNHIQQPVSYQTIRDIALANEADLNIGFNRFFTLSGPRVSSTQQLFADPAAPPTHSAVVWQFGHVEALRHFRNVVLRPHFVSRELEINLQRQFLFFGSEHTDRVPLNTMADIDGQVYIVGLAGEIVFTIKSDPNCCKKPENQVTRFAKVRPGRLLSLPSNCYNILARRNGTDYAMAYVGSVAMAQHPSAERVKPKK